MDASSVAAAAARSSDIDEATVLPPLPELCTTTSPNPSSRSLTHVDLIPKTTNMTMTTTTNVQQQQQQQRRQSLKGCAGEIIPENDIEQQPEFNSSSRSTSTPQLMSVKCRARAYRRASLKSASSSSTVASITSPFTTSSSRIVKISRGGKIDRRSQTSTQQQQIENSNENNVSTTINDTSYNSCLSTSPRCYPYTPACDTKNNNVVGEADEKQQPKSKSCGSFLPILSLLPHTVISFQYPSPKIKFSWWRNKIS